MSKPLRWGILSAGKISNDFCIGMSTLPRSEHRIMAVGARNLESAKNFAREFGIPKSYGNYEDLCKDPEIDVIYVGTVNTQHLPCAKLALSWGKHVLCEKPLCVNVRETKELIECAKENKVFLMEGIWSRFMPVNQYVKDQVDKGTIGDVVQIICPFGFVMEDIQRLSSKDLAGGTTLDLGIYCVSLAQFIFREKPEKIFATGHLNANGVDDSVSTTLTYSGGKMATFITSMRAKLPCEAHIIGTKGWLKLEFPFWCGTKVSNSEGIVKEFPLPASSEGKKQNFLNPQNFSFEIKEVGKCIQNGLTESSVIPHSESILLAEIIESIRKQVGVVFSQD